MSRRPTVVREGPSGRLLRTTIKGRRIVREALSDEEARAYRASLAPKRAPKPEPAAGTES